jgi:hypothetical protein
MYVRFMYFYPFVVISLSFLLLSDTKKSMFYVVQSRPKLDCTFQIEISVLFSYIETHDVPNLSWDLVRDTLSSCIVDRSRLQEKLSKF